MYVCMYIYIYIHNNISLAYTYMYTVICIYINHNSPQTLVGCNYHSCTLVPTPVYAHTHICESHQSSDSGWLQLSLAHRHVYTTGQADTCTHMHIYVSHITPQTVAGCNYHLHTAMRILLSQHIYIHTYVSHISPQTLAGCNCHISPQTLAGCNYHLYTRARLPPPFSPNISRLLHARRTLEWRCMHGPVYVCMFVCMYACACTYMPCMYASH